MVKFEIVEESFYPYVETINNVSFTQKNYKLIPGNNFYVCGKNDTFFENEKYNYVIIEGDDIYVDGSKLPPETLRKLSVSSFLNYIEE